MLTASIQKYLNQLLAESVGIQISSLNLRSIGGGCISETYQVRINGNINFFLKANSATKYPGLFQTEMLGLNFLGRQKEIRVPSVVGFREVESDQILLLEWINEGEKTKEFWARFGEQLAALHSVTDPHFGFRQDNYIGSLPQLNELHQNWTDFFIHCRLHPQIKLAREKNLIQTNHVGAFENLYGNLPAIFGLEKAALLHGDLWSGNFMCDQNSYPVLIDPAIYFGHRSMDLAMTTLFGGFNKLFYESYDYQFPLPGNYREQWDICNLYPLLIHLNLFGAAYLGQIESILKPFR
jgi:fructosamine-3-kinase